MSKSELMVSEALEIIYYVLQKKRDQFLTFSEIISSAKKEILGFEMCYSSTYNGILQQRLNKMGGVYRLFNFDSWTWMFTNRPIPQNWVWPDELVEEILEWTKSEDAKNLDLSNLPRPYIIHTVQLVMEDKMPVLKFCFPLSITIEHGGVVSWYWEVVLNDNPKLKAIF